MKKILAFTFALLTTVGTYAQDEDPWVKPKPADYPVIAKNAPTVAGFIPVGYKLVKSVTGDLNGDKVPDAAVHIMGTSKQFLNKNEGLGGDIYDTNPRILVILFRDKPNGGYSLAEQSNTFIIAPYSPVSTEPFQDMSIRKGVLEISFELWQSAGGWGATNASYKFKFTGGEFSLIGADSMDYQRNSGDSETRSYNFLTNRLRITKGSMSSDKPGKVRWKTLKKQKLKTFETFPIPFEWEIEPDVFL
jgi:hypothetical protein